MNKFRFLVVAFFTAIAHVATAATINQMYLATFGHYTQTYNPGGQFMILSQADYYRLSDGTSWSSGAGWHPDTHSTLASVSISGSTITYTFNNPASGVLFQNTDYDSGDHSAQGILGLPTSLQIVAMIGSTTGVLQGYTQIMSNDETWYGQPRFNFYSAPVGTFVYFQQNFSLLNSSFTQTLFDQSFIYNETGYVDFTRTAPVPEPRNAALLLFGLLAVLGIRMANRRAVDARALLGTSGRIVFRRWP
jgi:hypothetical protein